MAFASLSCHLLWLPSSSRQFFPSLWPPHYISFLRSLHCITATTRPATACVRTRLRAQSDRISRSTSLQSKADGPHLDNLLILLTYLSLIEKSLGKSTKAFGAEEEGFEPPVPRGTTVFKTAAFDHSATPLSFIIGRYFQTDCKCRRIFILVKNTGRKYHKLKKVFFRYL